MTTRQLQHLLHVDRITIYRMQEEGRLPGFKVGGQWRFPRREVENWLQGQRLSGPPAAYSEPHLPPITPVTALQGPLPLSCLQAIQDILAEACETVAITVSPQGAPLTEVSRPSAFCAIIMSTEEGRRRCLASWQELAAAPGGGGFVPCHAGLSYLVHQVSVNGESAAVVLLGQLRPERLAPTDRKQHTEDLERACGLPSESLGQVLSELPAQSEDSLRRAARLLQLTARTFAEIGQERTQLLGRLQRIAEMTILD
jgi:excisionase family DNA binding protein